MIDPHELSESLEVLAPEAPRGPRAPAVKPSLPKPSGDDGRMLGQTLGAYRVVRRIGKGRMSTVYMGEHVSIGSHVAIKVLHPHLAADPWMVARFYAEARALSLAAHENIVTVLDTGAAGPSQHYLTMEYLEGRPLAALAAVGPLPAHKVVPILTQVCDALAAGHARGLVHRDLRAENILLIRRAGSEHFVKLLDFGTAALVGESRTLPPADGRIDVHALGAIAYQLLTGRSAFDDALDRQSRRCSPREVNAAVPEALSALIERVLADRPEDRISRAEQFREALTAALQGAAPVAAPQPVVQAQPRPAVKPAAPTEPEEATPSLPRARGAAGPELQVRFHDAGGAPMGLLRCVDVGRAGLFACREGTLPSLMSRVRLTFLFPNGRELSCGGEVVRHVDGELARVWGMPAGFGVQFVNATKELKEAIDGLARSELPTPPYGFPAPVPGVAEAPVPSRDDSVAEPLLRDMLSRPEGDPYALLKLKLDAATADVRQRAREEQKKLEALRERPLSSAQQEKLTLVLGRVTAALGKLGQPEQRLEYDARIGNFQGVARCLAAGVRATDLEAHRRRYLSARRASETRAMVYALTARSYEGQGELDKAMAQYEMALREDPLNLELQRAYWSLKRKLDVAHSLTPQASLMR